MVVAHAESPLKQTDRCVCFKGAISSDRGRAGNLHKCPG